MALVYSVEYVFPIFGGEIDTKKNHFHEHTLLGTAFCIGKNYFITAGHVIENSKKYKDVVMATFKDIKKGDHTINYHVIKGMEVNTSTDIGVINVNYPKALLIKWDPENMTNLTDVQTYGFPFGYDSSSKTLKIRTLKGYIVSSGKFSRLSASPEYYELSFFCPRGISGAPLIQPITADRSVKGIIIGNEAIEIEIYSETEIDDDKNEKIIYQKTETNKYGIAIQSGEIFNLHFELLKSTIHEQLDKNKLIG